MGNLTGFVGTGRWARAVCLRRGVAGRLPAVRLLGGALSCALVVALGVPIAAAEAAIPGDANSETAATVNGIYRSALSPAGLMSPFRARPAAAGVEYGRRSAKEALGLAVAQNPRLFAAQPGRVLDPPAGSKIEQYLDDFSARVDVPGQASDVIVQSLTPIRVTHGGVKQPVDLTIVDTGEAFAPKMPVAPVALSHRLADGLTVAKGIGMRVVGASTSASAEVEGPQVFYANALQDADVFATPLPAGSETFVQLRSYSSPRLIALQFDLPDGARLAAGSGPNAGAMIMRGDDVLATIDPPVSADANGTLVPTTSRVDGTRLILDVAVTRETPLPVVVDPIVTDHQFAGGDAASIDGQFSTTRGWRHQTSGALANFTFTPGDDDSAAGGTCGRSRGGALTTLAGGLCVVSHGNVAYASGGEVGEWAFRPPSGLRSYSTDGPNVPTDAYIYRADVRMNFAKLSTPATAFMYAGLRSGRDPNTYIGSSADINASGSGSDLRNGVFTSGLAGIVTYNDSMFRIFCVRSDCGGDLNADSSNDGAFFTFGAWVKGAGNAIGVNAQGAIFYENDRTNPTVPTHVTSTDLSAWKGSGSVTTVVGGHDAGMGTKTVGEAYINRAGTLAAVPYSSGCDGRSASPCNADLAQTLTTSIDDLPEGANPLQSYATDVLGKTGMGSVLTVKVDRSAPSVTQSGSLWDARTGFILPGQDYALTVNATDGDATSAGTQRSGATNVEVTVDGQAVPGGSITQPCTAPAGSCPLSLTVQFTAALLAGYGPGPHTVSITATDALGQKRAPTVFDIESDTAEPTLELDGRLADVDGQVLTEDSYTLRAQALDTDAELYGSGLASLGVALDGQQQSTTVIGCVQDEACEQARSFTWNTASAGNGDHTITVTATDKAGNTTSDSIGVDLERPAAQPSRTAGTQRMKIYGAKAGDQAGSGATALGDVNDDGLADYAVGAPNATAATTRTRAGVVYIVLGRSANATIDLANPGAGVTRISGPATNAYCGSSIAAVGDVNGDGIGDLLIGCPGMDAGSGTLSQQAKAYLVLGSAAPANIDLASLGTSGFAITGPRNAYAGAISFAASRPMIFGENLHSPPLGSASVTQDVNGDDLADLVIADSAVAQAGQASAGGTYVIFGKTDSTPVDVNALGTAGFIVRGSGKNTLSGYSAAIVGDVTGDSLADIVVGAPGRDAAPPAAYVVAGADSSATVDLGTPNDRVVKLTAGSAQDRLGVDVAALGDTSLDGTADYAISTTSGAFVVRDTPTVNSPLTSANAYAVSGPVNAPALQTRIPATQVSAAGDVNQDGRADLEIGYPDAAGTGRGYTVHSPESNRTVSVAALPGQSGVALAAGNQSDRSGAAIAGADQTANAENATEPVQAILGAPSATPVLLRSAAGQAIVVTDITPQASSSSGAAPRATATATASGSNGCYNDARSAYPFDVGPNARYGYRVTINADKTANYGKANAILPPCRQTIRQKIDRVPTGFVKASFDYKNLPFNGTVDANGQISWTIRDSFNNAFATLRQTVRSAKGKRVVTRWQVVRGSDQSTVTNTDPGGLISVTVQGYACFVGNGSRTDRVMIALRPGSAGGAGVRGFIDRSALKTTYISDKRLASGDTGCRTDRGLTKPLSTPVALTPYNLVDERYQGKTTAARSCPDFTAGDCGARYDSYEPPTFPGIKIMALSSTGVTGGDNAGRSGGGVAMAVISTSGPTFVRLDRLGYNDPNVPCTRTPSVRWVFGNANPGKGKQAIYGWLAERASTDQLARGICPPQAP
jgi:hypothetical protein